MSDYRPACPHTECYSGDEGITEKAIGIKVAASLTDQVLESKIAKWHDDKLITYNDSDFGNSFESEFDSWSDLYRAFLSGQSVDSIEGVDVELLEELHAEGYISNFWFSCRSYFAHKHSDGYFVSTNSPKRLIDDGLEAFNTEDIIAELVKSGLIEKLDDFAFIRTGKWSS